jgi:hypothetical protein
MHQQLWGYKVEEQIYLGVRERKSLNIAALVSTVILRPNGPGSHKLPCVLFIDILVTRL